MEVKRRRRTEENIPQSKMSLHPGMPQSGFTAAILQLFKAIPIQREKFSLLKEYKNSGEGYSHLAECTRKEEQIIR